MASVERMITEGAETEKTPGPLNFSHLTPCNFGISVQSFTPVSDGKDKSRLAQIKARRRSSVGVRGSPETNSLIRFIAQQRMKTPKTPQTPEPVRNSPFPLQAAASSSLRQKMASFQTLMDLEESEACDPVPRQDSNPGGCIKTRDYLTDGYSYSGGKENLPLPTTPTPSKRRRLGPLETCKLEIRDPNTPLPQLSVQGPEKDEKPMTRGPLPEAVLMSPPKKQASTPAKNQQDGVSEAQSSSQSDPAIASSLRAESPFLVPTLPSVLEMKTTGSTVKPTTPKTKKKSVRFGVPLSPEFFDKNQPPSTPLRKGATPARAPTPGGALQLRSVLKTPQRSESQSPQTPLELCSPTLWASPVFSLPRSSRVQSVGEDTEEMSGKIVFPSMDETDSPAKNDAAEDNHITASSNDGMEELTLMSEQQEEREAPAEAPSTPQSRNNGGKTEESQPARRLTRSAVKLACGEKTDGVFELQSSSQSPPDDLAAVATPDQPESFSDSGPEMKPTGDEGSTEKSPPRTKKKSVRFGVPLSPEFFDKNEPPSTPLQKGGTPARAATPGGALQLRSLLKTPQRSESQSPQTPLELCSPSMSGASPVFSIPGSSRVQSVVCREEDRGDTEEMNGKVVFPSMKEMDSPETRDAECKLDIQPLNLNTAFLECQSPIVTDDEPNTSSHVDALHVLALLPEQEQQLEAAVEVQAPAPSRKRKTKLCVPEQPEESEPVKRSTRSAAKSACGKMTKSATATRRWNKDVDRSLYGSRAYASKNPTLSPITETFIGLSPAAPHTPWTSSTASYHVTHSKSTGDSRPVDETVTIALGNPSEDPLTTSSCRNESRAGRGRRPSGPRRGRKRKVSHLDDISACEETLAQPGEKMEEQTTTELEASRETPLSHSTTESGQGSEAELHNHTSNDEHCSGSDMKLEAPASTCRPAGEESSSITGPLLEPKKNGKRGRRSSIHTPVLQEPCEVREEENNSSTSSDKQEQRVESGLAPLQTEFYFEDVFKPVASRGQRSVRRSLRNQNTAEQDSDGTGLTWLPDVPSESRKEGRRSSRGRRISAKV